MKQVSHVLARALPPFAKDWPRVYLIHSRTGHSALLAFNPRVDRQYVRETIAEVTGPHSPWLRDWQGGKP